MCVFILEGLVLTLTFKLNVMQLTEAYTGLLDASYSGNSGQFSSWHLGHSTSMCTLGSGMGVVASDSFHEHPMSESLWGWELIH